MGRDGPRERRRASVLSFKGAILVSDDTCSLHILADRLLHPPVDPLLQLFIVRNLALLLRPFMLVTAAGAFFSVVSVAPFIIEDVPQVSPVVQALEWWTWTPFVLELLLELLDKLMLLLDEAVLSPDVIQAGVFILIEAGLMV
ncbi:hypothetical protein AAC387_Pa11g0251 [Persea americana]